MSTTPSYSGRGTVGLTVTLAVDGAQVCSGLVDANGNWACSSSIALSAGNHQAVATQSNPAGSTDSQPVGFAVVVGAPPSAPVITLPEAGSVTSKAMPDLAGHAEPNSSVTVRLDGSVACTVTASASGDFSCTSTLSLPDGSHTATATATNANGTSDVSTAVPFSIDTTAPNAPVITAPANGSQVGATPLLAATSEVGSTVLFTIDGAAACSAVADAQGVAQCYPANPLSGGAHAMSAKATDAAGNHSAVSAPVSFTVAGAPIDQDAVVAEAGLDYRASANLTLGVSYSGQAGDRASDNAVKGRMEYRF